MYDLWRYVMREVKKRIYLTVDDQFYHILKQHQKIKGITSLSSTVLELAKEALEIKEDIYFTKIADQRKNEKTISHKNLWEKSQ